jgi:hypothetical protein
VQCSTAGEHEGVEVGALACPALSQLLMPSIPIVNGPTTLVL